MATPSPARMHDFEVVSSEPIAKGIYRLVIKAPRLANMLVPGQFVNIAVPGNPMQPLRCPLSFQYADKEAGTVELWYAVVGDATSRMSKWTAGMKSDLLGPGGHGWSVPEAGSRMLLVAGGIGVPPVLCLARLLAERGVKFDVAMGSASYNTLVGVNEFKQLGAESVHVCTDDGSCGYHGFCTDPAAALLGEHTYAGVATCGPEIMMKKVAHMAHEAGVPCEVSLERMMSCGFGACNTCNVETKDGMKGACTCGPIFDAEEVVW